jgi:hypothetical protein
VPTTFQGLVATKCPVCGVLIGTMFHGPCRDVAQARGTYGDRGERLGVPAIDGWDVREQRDMGEYSTHHVVGTTFQGLRRDVAQARGTRSCYVERPMRVSSE